MDYSELIKSLLESINVKVPDGANCIYGWIPDYEVEKETMKNLKPIRVIYNPPSTIAYFPDGDKIVVKCAENETFVPEVGVMACIIKKLYGKRSDFLKVVKKGYTQPPQQPKKAKKTESEE